MLGTTLAAALAVALLTLPAGNAQAARFYNPGLTAPPLAETVACRTVRERVVRPSGRVVYRVKRRCGPRWSHGSHRRWGRAHCRYHRARVVRPNGSVVYRTVRRCR